MSGMGAATTELPGTPQWTPQKALCALRYHTKLVFHLLEKLDLPFGCLQELRLGCKRRRPVSSLAGGSGCWRASPWGAVYLAIEPCCCLWKQISESRPDDGGGDRSPFTFGCLSFQEVDLVAEVEVHVCAALRHLARASEQEAQAARVARMGPGASRGRVGFEAATARCFLDEGPECELSSTGSGADDCTSAKSGAEVRPTSKKGSIDDVASPAASTRAGNDGSESGRDGCDSSSSGTGYGPAFAACFERLVQVAWAFYLRVQLLGALLRGDALESATWSVRFLGLAEPWGLRRVQELALHTLEFTVEMLQTSKGLEVANTDDAWKGLREACIAYLGAPVIPRFESRLKRSVSSMSDLGLRPQKSRKSVYSTAGESMNGDLDIAGDLEKTLLSLLGDCGVGVQGTTATTGTSAPRQFDGSGRGLGAFRAADQHHAAFRKTLVEATSGHCEGICQLDPLWPTLAGAEAAAKMRVHSSWPPERHRHMLEVLSSMPLILWRPSQLVSEAPAPASPPEARLRRGLANCSIEPEALDEGSDNDTVRNGLAVDDVMLDLDRRAVSRAAAAYNKQGSFGLCCSGHHAV